ncbi:T9SS type A sorting domain-containing protein [Hymenobacter lapidiphilus]|uniref:T9SS type A sorting domain-containing protein n=1 Tax=Hymenobacter sp. CCM 8763 TaxID=2303334 RepID=UPI00167C7599|nr:T9SS type A sorting domain-containing protein [Hymenobacter sp. CCM 8763]
MSFGGSLICETTNLLQRVVNRQLTPDSLIYVVRYQSRTQTWGAPGCPAAGVTFQPPTTVRQAASLRTGQWRMSLGGAVGPSRYVQLLAYEWTAPAGAAMGITMGHPIVPGRQSGGTCGPTATLRAQQLFRIRGGMEDIYLPYFDFDWAGRNELLNAGLGVVQLQQGYGQQLQLTYHRRTGSAGTTICGSREPFDLLLSAPGGKVATIGARLYPNPATTTATLELPAPTAVVAQLTLINTTGQTLRTQLLPIGTMRAEIVLAGLPAGLYLVRLEQSGSLPVVLRLHHMH